jgi:hypothetical protein
VVKGQTLCWDRAICRVLSVQESLVRAGPSQPHWAQPWIASSCEGARCAETERPEVQAMRTAVASVKGRRELRA